MRSRIRAALVLAAVAVVPVGGCGAPPAAPARTGPSIVATPQAGEPWYDEVEPAAAAGPVGGCGLRVTFDVPDRWRARAVPRGEPIDDPTRQDGATLACEIDAGPAGRRGFLRVWLAPARTRPALEAFLAADPDATGVEYRDAAVAGRRAVEATYLRISRVTPEGRRERVLSVRIGARTVILVASGDDSAQFRAILPGYLLARQTLAPIRAPRARPR